jgi:Ca2+-binding RTX toxin-like protein
MDNLVFFDAVGASRATPGHEALTFLPDGRAAILWSETIVPGGDDDRLMLQLDAAGDPPPAPVTLDTGDMLYSDAVLAALPDGRLVASWRAYDRVAGVETDRVLVQVLDAQGAPQGQPAEFPTGDDYWHGRMLVPTATGFDLVWWDQGYDAAAQSSRDIVIHRQGFDGQGAPDGAATEIARIPPGQNARIAGMTPLENGNIAVVWTTMRQDAQVGGYNQVQADTVFARVFAPDGTPVTGVLALSAPDATSNAGAELVALPGGGFGVVWNEGFTFQNGRTIAARAFDAAGAPVGPVQRADFRSEGLIDAVAMPDGRVVIAVDDREYDFSGGNFLTRFNVTLQELGPDMAPLGPPERVLSDVGNPFDIALAADAAARVGISWRADSGSASRLDLFDATAFVRPGPGDDVISMDGTEAGLAAGAGNDTVTGSAAGDAILGGDGDDLLSGAGGDDRVAGEAGDDILLGGPGDDRLIGGPGDDRLIGGDGADTLEGGAGRDILNGGAGADMIYGWETAGSQFGSGLELSDTILGMEGNDTIDAGGGNDLVWGGADDDLMFGGVGADTLAGQDGADTLAGDAGADELAGGAGDDRLDGGQGFDRLNGGAGADLFVHESRFPGGSDWIQDYSAAEGDRLFTDREGAQAGWYQVNIATAPGAGAADVAEAFVIFRPTGQIVWALVDGAGQSAINLQIGGQVFDLMG